MGILERLDLTRVEDDSDANYIWITREDNDDLFMYDKEPIKVEGGWNRQEGSSIHRLNPKKFPDVNFENSPVKFILKKV